MVPNLLHFPSQQSPLQWRRWRWSHSGILAVDFHVNTSLVVAPVSLHLRSTRVIAFIGGTDAQQTQAGRRHWISLIYINVKSSCSPSHNPTQHILSCSAGWDTFWSDMVWSDQGSTSPTTCSVSSCKFPFSTYTLFACLQSFCVSIPSYITLQIFTRTSFEDNCGGQEPQNS